MSLDENNAEKKKELQQLLSEMNEGEIAQVLNEELDAETKNKVDEHILTKNKEKSLANLRPWKPGQSGNPLGRPKNDFSFVTQFRHSFTKKASELIPTKKAAESLGINPESITIGELYAVSMLTESMKGRDSIAKEIINRLDGKVPDVILTDIGDEARVSLDNLTGEQLRKMLKSIDDDNSD